MFDSGTTAADLIAALKEEVDIALPIPNRSYVDWLNSLTQLLYTEFIREQRLIRVENPGENQIVFRRKGEAGSQAGTVFAEQEDALADVPRFEDLIMVYADGQELTKTTLHSFALFENVYAMDNGALKCRLYDGEYIYETVLYYTVRPVLIACTADKVGAGNVMVPPEFLELVKARLRGEAYKLANEDAIAAKWLTDYNVLLETFRSWIELKKPQFGI